MLWGQTLENLINQRFGVCLPHETLGLENTHAGCDGVFSKSAGDLDSVYIRKARHRAFLHHCV
jgi:hypothetical protein